MIFSIFEAALNDEFGDDSYHSPNNESLKPLAYIQSKTSLSFKVKPDANEHISLSTGERLQDIEGRINICAQDEGLQEGALGIGYMTYSKASSNPYPDPSWPAMYFIEVTLPPLQFAGLVESARNGRIPKSISIRARGMELPDEFSIKWDVKASPALHVASVSFSTPLAYGETILNEGNLFAPTSVQVFGLRKEIDLLTKVINAKLKWLLGVMVFLAVVMAVFKH